MLIVKKEDLKVMLRSSLHPLSRLTSRPPPNLNYLKGKVDGATSESKIPLSYK